MLYVDRALASAFSCKSKVYLPCDGAAPAAPSLRNLAGLWRGEWVSTCEQVKEAVVILLPSVKALPQRLQEKHLLVLESHGEYSEAV